MKKPKLKRDWIGRRVRTLRPLSSGRFEVAVGKILTVTHSWMGLTLVTDPCPSCGVGMYITKVPEEYVELLPIIDQSLTKTERRNLYNLGPRC